MTVATSDGKRLIEPHSVFTATAVNHISYKVADYATSRDFYVDVLGMTCTFDDGEKCAVSFGNPARALYIGGGAQPGDAFVDHFAISIADFDLAAVEAELRRYGFEPEFDGDHAWTIRDADGYKIQVCAETGVFPGAAKPGSTADGKAPSGSAAARPGAFTATAVNHIAYRVADYAVSRDFYLDLFGMRLAFEDGKKCSVAFGDPEDAIYINPAGAGQEAFVDHLAVSVADFDLRAAESTLRQLGLDPEPDGDYAWTVLDPDGYKIQVCAEKGVYPGARLDPYHNPA